MIQLEAELGPTLARIGGAGRHLPVRPDSGTNMVGVLQVAKAGDHGHGTLQHSDVPRGDRPEDRSFPLDSASVEVRGSPITCQEETKHRELRGILSRHVLLVLDRRAIQGRETEVN